MKLLVRIPVYVCLALAGLVCAKPCTSQTSLEQTRSCGNPLLGAIQARDLDGIRRLFDRLYDVRTNRFARLALPRPRNYGVI